MGEPSNSKTAEHSWNEVSCIQRDKAEIIDKENRITRRMKNIAISHPILDTTPFGSLYSKIGNSHMNDVSGVITTAIPCQPQWSSW
jgi:hypothetical protein